MFSIVICTYNPQPAIFQRLLSAVKNIGNNNIPHEIIVVDNNSNPPLNTRQEIKPWLDELKELSLVSEKKPGLTSARIAGIRHAKYDWVIFFDDDNEPQPDYLVSAAALIEKYPQVGLWGPGNLQVEYTGKQESGFLKKTKWLFQERNYSGTHFDNNSIEGSEYYPFGTGMIVKKQILAEYAKRVEEGRYTMSDRAGKSLMSAGDIQVLFTGLQMGFYAGSCSSLGLTHLIDENKSTPGYITRLVYGLNSSQQKAYLEVFPERVKPIDQVDNFKVLHTLQQALRTFRLNKKNYTLSMFISRKLGELNAAVIAHRHKKPFFLSLYESWIRW